MKFLKKEESINNKLFKAYFTDYQSPSIMYKKLSKTEGVVNEVRVESIEKVLSELKRVIEYAPKDDAFKIEENERILDIEFNNKIQSEQGLKFLTQVKCLVDYQFL